MGVYFIDPKTLVAFVRGHVADVLCEAFGKYLGYSVYRHV